MFNKLSISKKLLLGFGITILFTIILYSIYIGTLSNSNYEYNDGVARNEKVILQSMTALEKLVDY